MYAYSRVYLYVSVSTCVTVSKLRHSEQLRDVFRTDHMDDYILERTAMPEENVRKAQGNTVFEEELPLVSQFQIYYFLTCSCMKIEEFYTLFF